MLDSLDDILAGGLIALVLYYVVLPIVVLGMMIYGFSSAVASVKIAPATPISKTVIETPSVNRFTNYSGAEPEWTKAIPSWVICDWFFLFFVLNAFILVVLLFSIIFMTVSSTLPKNLRFSNIFMLVTQLMVSGTSTLFYYLLCDRSLKPTA
jgi:hypothetical protein